MASKTWMLVVLTIQELLVLLSQPFRVGKPHSARVVGLKASKKAIDLIRPQLVVF